MHFYALSCIRDVLDQGLEPLPQAREAEMGFIQMYRFGQGGSVPLSVGVTGWACRVIPNRLVAPLRSRIPCMVPAPNYTPTEPDGDFVATRARGFEQPKALHAPPPPQAHRD